MTEEDFNSSEGTQIEQLVSYSLTDTARNFCRLRLHSFLYCCLTFEESRDLDLKRAELAFGFLRAGRNPRGI